MTDAPFLDKVMRRLRQRQSAQLVLDDDLPGRGNAQEDLVVRIGKNAAGGIGQFRTVRYDPEKRAGVEQNVQDPSPWNRASVSAGRSSKNVAGNENTPFARPIGRGLCL